MKHHEENEARDYAELITFELKKLDRENNQDEIDLFFRETILDFEVFRSARRNTIAKILRTTGGPHCEISWESSSPNYLTVSVVWSRYNHSENVYAPNLGEQIDAILEVAE